MAIPETEGPTQSVGVCVSLSLGFFLFFFVFFPLPLLTVSTGGRQMANGVVGALLAIRMSECL